MVDAAQVTTSPDALRAAVLSPVKCEELFYRDARLLDGGGDVDQPPPGPPAAAPRGAEVRGGNNNAVAAAAAAAAAVQLYNRVSLAVHQPTAAVTVPPAHSSATVPTDKRTCKNALMFY